MATAGFFSGLANEVSHERDEQRQDQVVGRERQANEIDAAIAAVASNPNLSNTEKVFQIGELRKKMTALYPAQDHKGLLDRIIKRKQGQTQNQPMSETIPGVPSMQIGGHEIPGTPAQITAIRPGMTLDEVLAMSGSSQAPKTTLSPEEQAKAERIKAGLEPRATTEKSDTESKFNDYVRMHEQVTGRPMTPDEKATALDRISGVGSKEGIRPEQKLTYNDKTDTIADAETGKVYRRSDKGLPADVKGMFDDRERVEKQELEKENRKNAHQAVEDDRHFRNAVALGNIREAQSVYKDASTLAEKAQSDDTLAKARLANPSSLGDQGLVISWVRAQIAGAGRINDVEIRRGLQAGSYPERMQRAWSVASTGKFDDKFRKEIVNDIHDAYTSKKSTADSQKQQLDDVEEGAGIKTKANKKAPKSATAPEAPPANVIVVNPKDME